MESTCLSPVTGFKTPTGDYHRGAVKDVEDALVEWRNYLLRYQPKVKLVFTDPVKGVVTNNDYYKTPWERACREAGYMVEKTNPKGETVLKPSLLFCDARRSFRTYLPDEIAKSDGMAAMGHTLDTTFGRYHVEPQRAALRVLDALEKPEAKGLTLPEQLAQLHSLFQAGALTEQMYQSACANVLGLAQPFEQCLGIAEAIPKTRKAPVRGVPFVLNNYLRIFMVRMRGLGPPRPCEN
jgi:hypothetical protein